MTVRWLGYKPAYSLANLLSELAAFGDPRTPALHRDRAGGEQPRSASARYGGSASGGWPFEAVSKCGILLPRYAGPGVRISL